MKSKHVVLLILLVAIVCLLYLYKKWQSPDHNISFSAELETKQQKLELLLSQLSAAEIKKACLDKIVACKASLITCLLMLFCLSTSVIYTYYNPDVFPKLYFAATWYILVLISALVFHKIPSWSTLMEVITTHIRTKEYRNHNFNPNSIPEMAIQVVILKEEITELEKQQEMTIVQNACGYR